MREIASPLSGFRSPFGRRLRRTGFPAITGRRLVVVGDSRVANGISGLGAALPSGPGALAPFTGAVQRVGSQGIHTWLAERIDHKLQTVGHLSLGGHTSARIASDEAIAAVIGMNPDVVFLYGGTNDGGSVFGYTAVPLGDPSAAPGANAAVGAMPATPGTGLLGTTFGNLHKIISTLEAAGIPVIAWETPRTGPSSTRNAYIAKWYRDQYAAKTYSNFYYFDAYSLVAANPSEVNNPATATGAWTTAYSALGDITTGGDGLHVTTVGARIIAEALAADPVFSAAIAGLPSQLVLPDGTNSGLYLNTNPFLLMGAGTGIRNNGITGQVPTGLSARHTFTGGTIAVDAGAIAAGQGVRFTVTRTGGAGETVRAVELSFIASAITPIVGEAYVLEAEFDIPARNPTDILGASLRMTCTKAGLQDEAGTSIASLSFNMLGDSIYDFPTNGEAAFRAQTPAFLMTPNVVATAGGSLQFSGVVTFNIRDRLDTATNGSLVLNIRSLGLRRVTGL